MKIRHSLILLFVALLSSGVALAQVEISINVLGGIDTSGGLGSSASGSLSGSSGVDTFGVSFTSGPSQTYTVTPEGIHGDFLAQSTYGPGGLIQITGPGGFTFAGTFTGGSSVFNLCLTAGPACLIQGFGASFIGSFGDGQNGVGSIDVGGDHIQAGEVEVAPTPEPASMVLLGSGALVVWLRKRKAKNPAESGTKL